MLYFKSLSTLMHDVHNNFAPPNISQLFTYSKDIHNYNIKSNQIYLPYSNIYKQKKEDEIPYYIHIMMESNLAINYNENK